MKIKTLPYDFTVCKPKDAADINLAEDFCFVGRTDEELSLVCKMENVPENTTEREDGWQCFRIEGPLDFSLVGILAKISAVLAENHIGIFAVSTYDTDYILTKKENFAKAIAALKQAGYEITG